MDARGAAHRREIAAMQLYQARLEQQLQSLRKDKERLALLSKELARRAEEAGLALTEQISDGCNAWLRWSTTSLLLGGTMGFLFWLMWQW